MPTDQKHDGLPVAGYAPQSSRNVGLVNDNKVLEEQVLRQLDHLFSVEGLDKRWLSVARTHVEEGFMAMNRAVFQPKRIALPGDEAHQ